MCAPTTSQYAAVTALRRCDADIEAMRSEYDMRRRFLVSSLNRMGLDCFEPEGAFYAFPSIRKTGLSSEEFCEKLLFGKKVAVVPGNAFGDSGEGHVAHQLFVFHRPLSRHHAPHRAVLQGAGSVSVGEGDTLLFRAGLCVPRRWPRTVEGHFCPKARPPGRWARASRVLVKPNMVAKHAPERPSPPTPPCWTPCVRRCGGVALKVSPWRIPPAGCTTPL
jgi:hypothetical protein